MLFGFPFEQGRSFAKLFQKMKAQHAHHIFCQFAPEYFGDSRARSILFIEYQQARLDAAAEIFICLSQIFFTTCQSRPREHSGSNTGSITTANMHFSTA